MPFLLGVLIGGLGGGVLVGGLTYARTRALGEERGRLTLENQRLNGEVAALRAGVANLSGVELAFERVGTALAGAVARDTSERYERLTQERESRLALALGPLEALMSTYQQGVAAMAATHSGEMAEMREQAQSLLRAQSLVHEDTQRLTSLLGRSADRGRWGEVQLTNILELSGLREGIDYDRQVSVRTDGELLRPDVIVHVGHTDIVLDAKFPFDALDASARAGTDEERRAALVSHAQALGRHVRGLGRKDYGKGVEGAAGFVVCFLPSDEALSAALSTDGDLLSASAKSRVVLVGPSNLLALLWSVAAIIRQYEAVNNAQEIIRQGATLLERLRTSVEAFNGLGTALDSSVEAYNRAVRSIESRVMPAARRLATLGVGERPVEVVESESSVNALRPARWGEPSLFDEAGSGD